MNYKITYTKSFKKHYKKLSDIEKKTDQEKTFIFYR